MSEFSLHRARAAECQWKAKAALNEDDKQSWLAIADSWLQTAELREILERLERERAAA
ncbi:MAG: hypothetical protein WA652_20500 [Xanthobacteraceae bacterium]